MLKRVMVFLLVFQIATMAVFAQVVVSAKSDPHSVFKFVTLPDPNYFSRSFVLNVRGGIGDMHTLDSDRVINSCPQSQRGFLISWLQPGQGIAILPEAADVVMADCNGRLVRVNLKKDEAVVYDSSTTPDGNHQILAVVRCGNKVVEGVIRPVVKEVRSVIEKPVFDVQDRIFVIEKPVFTIVEKPVEITQPFIPQPPTPIVKKKGWKKWVWIGAGIAAGGIACAILCGGREDESPHKTGVVTVSPK